MWAGQEKHIGLRQMIMRIAYIIMTIIIFPPEAAAAAVKMKKRVLLCTLKSISVLHLCWSKTCPNLN